MDGPPQRPRKLRIGNLCVYKHPFFFFFWLVSKRLIRVKKMTRGTHIFALSSKHKILTLVVNPKRRFYPLDKWVVPSGKLLPGKYRCLVSPHCQVSPHWSKPHCQVSPYWVSLVLGCTCEKEARVNQHLPVHHEGWMESD
jgi:hypothetical protein